MRGRRSAEGEQTTSYELATVQFKPRLAGTIQLGRAGLENYSLSKGRALLPQRRRRIVLRQGYGRQGGSAALPGFSVLGTSPTPFMTRQTGNRKPLCNWELATEPTAFACLVVSL